MEKYRNGEKFITNEGYWVEVVEKLNWDKRRIRFENGHEVDANRKEIGTGKIKNPYHPSVHGVGYLGVGDYKAQIDGKTTPEYSVWGSVLKRCYDEKYQKSRPTYKSTTVCDEWLNFQNLAKWYGENLPRIVGEKFQLDKDLLQENIRDKIYSPDTCVFLPHNVNGFLANKYSTNTSGYTGVSWNKRDKKWQAQIMVFGEGKQKSLGYFITSEQASKAYQQARAIEAEKVKDYLKSLNYLPEEVVQLIK